MPEPIAIVGSACRFAGDSTSPSQLWKLLQKPRDVRKEIPEERFSAKGFYHPNGSHHGHSNVMHSYLINEDLGFFDAEFFGIKPVEAKAIDPQQRLLMEVVYEGLEAAGLPIQGLQGSDTSVYVGVMCSDYESLLLRDLQSTPTYLATGVGRSIMSNRISYFFDWRGPSITIDTACSSSLVAVHMAVQALRSGESSMAVACGSNLILGPENYIVESKLNMLSPDGISRMWDSDANGYARGDGVAAVVLKTLSQALADGDHIECVIRETGLNQDGATTGITMPSASAQEALIRSTYAKAGLDLKTAAHRPQFFEAHGTGTPAGDPIEAQAIRGAFYDNNGSCNISETDPLYVGSIKTILGHTEGTAGVAALMKASLALQNACIPPNLHFSQLSERVAPFYVGLEIVGDARPWPELPDGQPRRASVNSFGFGGANAHAIVESFEFEKRSNAPGKPDEVDLFAPFVFSTSSEQSLRANLGAYATFLSKSPDISARDLAWTLAARRSLLSHRVAISARSIEQLRSQIESRIREDPASPLSTKELPAARRGEAKILGIFTGQGAQYARMGAELVEKSPVARKIVQELEWHLAQLPVEDRPTWSLLGQILADSSSSRVAEAVISQPLCTAVQILLTDLLRLAHVQLDAVVGHSSGEIGAAYAAGYLTARDAIIIAYYRGLHARLSSSPSGSDKKGAMLAVGTSMEDATELCAMEEFVGRINVAASNSSSSVTISGDEDAIEELQVILNDEGRFNRRLRVDQAYHSKHMLPCSAPYIQSVRRCGVKARKPSGNVAWFSSVYDGPVDAAPVGLSDEYWAENMTRPVLFSQAVTSALNASSFDLALEVGPHPALKGPASQTIDEIAKSKLPFTGTLARNTDAVQAMSDSLGFLWSHLGNRYVDLVSYERGLAGQPQELHVIKGLPSYQWNHGTKHWHESRTSKKMRLRKDPFHPLLGDVSPDSSPHNLSWRNLLRANEMEWLSGHQVQGQTVFPAAGYVASALEASRSLAGGNEIRLIEVKDFIIHQAVAFDDTDNGIEVIISLAEITSISPSRISAKFTYAAALGAQPEDFSLAASGDIAVYLGEPSPSVLPARAPKPPHLIAVDTDRFYTALASLGYNFGGRFRSLGSLHRKHHASTCLVKMEPSSDGLFIHPAELDASFQSIILANSYPGDDQLLSLHLPTNIGLIRVNPALCDPTKRNHVELVPVDATLTPSDGPKQGFSGDVNLYTNDHSHAAIQVQAVKLIPLGGADAVEDRSVFSKMHWVPSVPDGTECARDTVVTQEHHDTLTTLERISTYYLRQFDQQVPEDSPLRSERPTSCYLDYARHMTSLVKTGQHRWAKKEWLQDTLEDVMEASNRFSDIPDVKVMHLVGQQMPRVFRGETTMLEEFRSHNVLDDYYAGGFGLRQSSLWLGRTVSQIAERYPHMNMLEIGAGTGGATKSILAATGRNFQTYTFTDVSAGFFENAAAVFPNHKDRMIFKTLDAERDPLEQGYTEGTYDLIVASFVIHATARLEVTMRNIRKILRPGGFLIVGEGSHNGQTGGTGGFIFGPLPGWWLGVDEGRTLSPFTSTQEWNRILLATGFSGVDVHPPQEFEDALGVSLFVSQAVDETVNFLREPLAAPPVTDRMEKLFIVGGQSGRSGNLVAGVKAALKSHAATIYEYKTLGDVDYNLIDPESSVIGLTELDKCAFEDITPGEFANFKKMFQSGKTLLWVTSGRLADEPYSNMTVGFGRTAVHEAPDLRLQSIDVPDPETANPDMIAEALLRLRVGARPEDKQSDDYLWSVESEIVVDGNGRQLVPRLRHLPEPNNRYNSARRPRTHEVDVGDSVLSLYKDFGGHFDVKELSRYDVTQGVSTDLVELRTIQSVVSAVKTPLGQKFLVLGTDAGSGTNYLALVSSVRSALRVPKSSLVQLPKSSDDTALAAIAASLVAMSVVDPLYKDQTLLVHNPSNLLYDAISLYTSEKGVAAFYTADSALVDAPSASTKLVPFVTQFELGRILPPNPSAFASFSTTGDDENEHTILASLPSHCRKETARTIFSDEGTESSHSLAETLGEALQRALEHVPQLRHDEYKSTLVGIQDLIGQSRLADPFTIVDWQPSTKLPVQVSRIDSQPMFRNDKTYWMVGLSGALGISLCDWAISRGARHLVLTSRNPKVEPSWVAAHKSNGISISIMPCDVTDEPRLIQVHQTICANHPPIVGVLNGAMVLRDVSIRNMSFEQMSDVVRPKVLGSIHLDRIFYSEPLEFFICFSSINCIIGNLGQANYAAANTFMCALAAQRRKRGLAATALNVGAIIGAGYMERESSKALDLTVSKMALMHLSEEDFHQLFAEGMEAGRPGNGSGPEVSTGLLEIPANTPEPPRWLMDPKFAHFIVHSAGKDTDKNEQAGAASIADQLQACGDQKQLEAIIQQAFAVQLRNVLQMSSPDDKLMALRSSEIGLDSLISVDIRTWFFKNFQVSMPVLKIMGNDTMANLAKHAAESVPPELVPQMGGGGDGTGASASPTKPDSTVDVDRSPIDSDVSSPDANNTSTVTTPERALSDKADNDSIDWEAESRPPTIETSLAQSPTTAPSYPPKTVLLTGVSGLLGHHLLDHLVKNTSAKIICVAVRRLEELVRTGRLPPPSARIVYYSGDLASPRLGLSEPQAADILSQVDAVIHNGADTSHLKYYQTLRASNVESTRFLLAACQARRVPLHYVSSVGVGLFGGRATLPAASVTTTGGEGGEKKTTTPATPPGDGSHGYMACKWVCERMLERASAEQQQLRIVVHRPSTIVREGADTEGRKAQMDWVNALLYYARLLRAVPRVKNIRGALDLVYVQNVCAAIVGRIAGVEHDGSKKKLLAPSGGGGGVVYVNEVGDVVIPLDRLTDIGKTSAGSATATPVGNMDTISMAQWTEKAIEKGLHPAVAALIEAMDTPGAADYPKLIRGSSD